MINRVEFVNELLKYASSIEDPDTIIDEMLAFLGKELGADRSYIFEDFYGEYFDNTYEWCNEGVSAEKDNLQHVPYDVCEVWYKEYDKHNNICILDIEEYKDVSRPMYDLLKPQGINTLVTGPLELNGKYIGFFGVDNPPIENIEDISAIITMLSYIMSIMIRHRDIVLKMKRISIEDQLTGVYNRYALEFLEEKLHGDDPVCVMCCDINGLKKMNDTKGHDAGDKLIRNTSNALAKIFDKKRVYRVGGDEFVVVYKDTSLEEFEKKVEKLRMLFDISDVKVALGYVHYKHSKFSLQQMMKEADAKMYDDKKEYYSNAGVDRRLRRRS